MSKMHRLIDDVRRKRKMWILSSTIVLLIVAVCLTCLLRIDSNKLIAMGREHLQRIIAENQLATELKTESVDTIAFDLKKLVDRTEKIPEKPRCASQNAISFLAATRGKEYEKEAMASATEYNNAVVKYSSGVADLRRKRQKIDSLILKLDDVRKILLSKQYLDAAQDLEKEISLFRRVCDQHFIFRLNYNVQKARLSRALEKMQSLLADSTIADFMKLSARHKGITDGFSERIDAIMLSERVAQTAEAKLRKMPYDANNAEKMWCDKVSASTNAIIISSRVALEKLTVDRVDCAKTIDKVRSTFKQAKMEVDILNEKFPNCVEPSDIESVIGQSGRIDELQSAMDGAVASCRSAINDDSMKAIRNIERLNTEAERLSRGFTCDEQKWIELFEKIGSLEFLSPASHFEIAIGRMTEISNDARNIERDAMNGIKRIQSLAQRKWNMQIEKLYDSQLAKNNELVTALSGATTRLQANSRSLDDDYSYLNQQLGAFKERSKSASTQLHSLKSNLPKDGTSVEKFKSDLAAIENETRQILESLNAWNKNIEDAVDRAKPRIRLTARLDGIEKRATVVSGIKGSGYVTPINGIEAEVGKRIRFAVEFSEDGVKYVGEKEHVVKAGAQTVVVELRPEFTLPYDFRYCGNCGNSLERHRHVRHCPYCRAELKR